MFVDHISYAACCSGGKKKHPIVCTNMTEMRRWHWCYGAQKWWKRLNVTIWLRNRSDIIDNFALWICGTRLSISDQRSDFNLYFHYTKYDYKSRHIVMIVGRKLGQLNLVDVISEQLSASEKNKHTQSPTQNHLNFSTFSSSIREHVRPKLSHQPKELKSCTKIQI